MHFTDEIEMGCFTSSAAAIECLDQALPTERTFETWDPSRSRFEQERALRRIYSSAQLALGERMAAEGIDDDGIGEQIAALDAILANPSPSKKPMMARLRAQRCYLLRKLADAALEFDAPLPGADDEFAEALRAKRQLASFLEKTGPEMDRYASIA